MMILRLLLRLVLIIYGIVKINPTEVVYKGDPRNYPPNGNGTLAELSHCSLTEHGDTKNHMKYPQCRGCAYYLSMDLIYSGVAPPRWSDSCIVSIGTFFYGGCSSKKTYFEYEIQELNLEKNDCISITDKMDSSSKGSCHFHEMPVWVGSGLKIITKDFCGHIKKTTYRGLSNEPEVEFTQNSSPGNTTVLPDAIRMREIPYRQPLQAENPECDCPANFIKHGCLCYGAFRSEKPITWRQAEESCIEKGAHLLSIIDQEEMTDIKHFIGSIWLSILYGRRTEISWIYIGLKDENAVNDFKWSDSNPVMFDEWYHPGYADRLPNLDEAIIKTRPQPSSQPTTRCTVMYVSLDYFWEKTHWCKVPCSYPIEDSAYICKRPANRNETSEEDNVNLLAPEGGVNGTFTTNTELQKPTPPTTITPSQSATWLSFQGTAVVNSEAVIESCDFGMTLFKGKCLAMVTSLTPLDKKVRNAELKHWCDVLNATIKTVVITDASKEQDLDALLRMWNHHTSYGRVLLSTEKNRSVILVHENDEENTMPVLNYYLGLEGSELDQLWSPDKRNVICERPSWQRRVVCNENQWSCDNGTCISAEYRCDGYEDCLDRSDEIDCHDETTPLFRCGDGQTISFSLYCDFIPHCANGADEANCIHPPCSEGTFRCDNGECLPMSQYCDFIPQCADKSDEPENCSLKCSTGFLCYDGKCIPNGHTHDILPDCPGISQEDERKSLLDIWRGTFVYSGELIGGIWMRRSMSPFCSSRDQVRCDSSNVKCFSRGDACVYDTDELGYMRSCRDGSHLRNCKDAECPGMFKCPNTYCIPVRKRCDGVWDCPYGLDEVDCPVTPVCPGFLRCRGETFCLDQTEVCDGRIHCKSSRDDEKMCGNSPCPQGCVCQGLTLSCIDRNLTSTSLIPRRMRLLNITRNKIYLMNSSFVGFYYLGWLDISHNGISMIEPGTFADTFNLLYVDLSYNKLSSIVAGTFKGLGRLETIKLFGNEIRELVSDAFTGLSNLKQLNLESQNLTNVVPYVFRGMSALLNLSLHNNSIEDISIDAFEGLGKLRSLDLESNKIAFTDPKVFQHFWLDTLKTDEFIFCCAANNLGENSSTRARTCTPEPDEFSSCSDLMDSYVLRIAIWVLGSMALLGNMFVLIWRCIHAKEGGVANCMVANLGVADLLMGVYLFIIGSADITFRGVYVIYSKQWTKSPICVVAGLLSFISSEMSVFMLVLITIDRAVAIVLSFKVEKLDMKKTRNILVVSWVTILTCGLLPLLDIDHDIFGNFYGSNGVCLPFSFSVSDDIYSSVFLAINLLAFFLITLGYISIYYVIRKSRKRFEKLGMQGSVSAELVFLKKMSFVVLSDFCCWIPIILLKFLAIGGLKLPQVVSAWTAVFVLPMNSAINPFLYTIGAVREALRSTSKKPVASTAKTMSTLNVATSQTLSSTTELSNVQR